MRALIIGFGSIGQRHATNLRAILNPVELVVLRREGRMDSAIRDLRAYVVKDLETALNSRPDFAVVATPSARHIDVLLPLLESGVPCYVEKPIVSRRDDLRKLASLLAGLTDVPITHAGCNLRYMPSLLKLRQLVVDGVIGNVVRASLQAGQWLPDWRPGRDYRATYSAQSSEGGGVVLDLMHEIDAARWLFGDFDRVFGIAGKLSSLDISAEDTACLVLGKRTGGPVVTIGLDYVSRCRLRRYEIIGEKGTLIWDFSLARLELITNSSVTPIKCTNDDFDMGKTYVTAMREFVEGVEHNCPTSQDIFEGMRSVDLTLRLREAIGL
ncbi:MAG: Gfo/Idh/MocA family oxidoreductase [Nitrospira sp.]|nr:Gfo/Idh/MocA family oxidoreductase [Nitrospira sp.]